jgi:hypothetical protein
MKNTLKRWVYSCKSILSNTVTGVGLFWLFVEIASYSTNGQIDVFTKSILFFLIGFFVIIIIALIKNKPKTVFTYQLRDKDNVIEVKVGDAFKNYGSLVIPINDHFDVSLGGNVKKATSLQNKLISDYYSDKADHLANDISKKIDMSKTHEIGTTIEVEQNKKTFYLLVNSKKKENNRVESTTEDFLLSLEKLWSYIALESGRNSVVTIPLINTNHGRVPNLNRSTAIKEIIRSYIEASKYLNVADKLIVSIHSNDLNKGSIELDEINEYLRFSCRHYRAIKFSQKPEGKGISASAVESLNN